MFKKTKLIELGADEAVAEKIEKALDEEVKQWIPKHRFDEIAEEKKKLEASVKERDSQLEQLKKTSGSNEELKKQIETLQEENKTKTEQHKKEIAAKEAEARKLRRQHIDENVLRDAKAKNVTATRALLETIDDDELDDEKYEKKRVDAVKKLAEAEDTKFLFGDGSSPKIDPFVPGGGKAPPNPTLGQSYAAELNKQNGFMPPK
ncbi:phage scaffolding protein [Methanolapillus millepedarum]|uniref:Uncharacterized protein n=1 Tax=Methanolapillus millepedarum TaxID=3028296 RepID=A0AA97A502_9EURY|nr:hypothetical protein MsAc7_17710 [Methanosarcinaceae archaeon Ac7]